MFGCWSYLTITLQCSQEPPNGRRRELAAAASPTVHWVHTGHEKGGATLRNKFYDGFHPRVSSPNLSDGEILLCSLRSTVHGDIWELIPSQSGQGPFGKGSQAGTPI
ncbi:hypothetical protein CC2G_014888 [Coprinopsis cinerea AmutBmut pab1-1]|nr:hypothetical protein CC2G_014888 [Coprinopsis cinerea AmutBmut pab1-1]